MKKQQCFILTLTFVIFGYSQKQNSFYPNFIGKEMITLENNLNWKILQKSSGDLNKDKLIDFALLIEARKKSLKHTDSLSKSINNKPRIVLIVLSQKNGKQTVVIQNNRFFMYENEGDLSSYNVPQLAIENGLLSIFQEFTRSNSTYLFEYEDGQMYNTKARIVYGDDGFTMDEYDFKKGVVSRTIESKEEDSLEKTYFDIKPKTLSEYGKMGSWEVIKGRRL